MNVMKNKKTEKIVIIVTALFVVVSILLVFGKNIFSSSSSIRKTDSTIMPEASDTTNEIKKNIVIEQDFINSTETISKIGIVFSRLSYKEGVDLAIELWNGTQLLASGSYKISEIEDQHRTFLDTPSLSDMKNKKLTLKIYPLQEEDTGLVIMMDKNAKASFRFGNKTIKGTLCFAISE